MLNDRGSMLPAVAVVLFGGLVAFGLALDLGRWSSTWREAAFAADVGAEAGAAMLADTAYSGTLALDQPLAEATAVEAALAARPRPGRTVVAGAQLDRVCVSLRQPFRPTLLRMAGVGDLWVSSAACASPAQG